MALLNQLFFNKKDLSGCKNLQFTVWMQLIDMPIVLSGICSQKTEKGSTLPPI